MKKRRFSAVGLCGVCALTVLCAFLILKNPSAVSSGIKSGLFTVGNVLIPSLFPFMMLSCFIANSGVCEAVGRILSPITRLAFRLPEEASATIIMSLIGGYPVGAKMTDMLFKEGKITTHQAQRLYLFCINAGPAFVVSTVGSSLLGSVKAGTVIFCSLTLSSLLIGFVSGFLLSEKEPGYKRTNITDNGQSVFSAFTKSASQATSAMLSVCSYVIVFTALCEGIRQFNLSDNITCLLFSIAEVTNGVISASGLFPLPVITAIIGFGGLCVHFQVMSGVVDCSMKIRHFLVARLINALLSSGICRVLLYLFPVEITAFAPAQKTVVLPYGISLPCCIAFLIMSVSLIFDIAPRRKV